MTQAAASPGTSRRKDAGANGDAEQRPSVPAPSGRLPRQAIWAVAVGVLCLAALVAGYLLPWMSSDLAGHPTVLGRAGLAHSATAYERHLVQAPAVAFPAAAGALALVALASGAAPSRTRARLLRSAWGLAAVAACVPLVTSARLGGFQIARALDPGPTSTHLLAASYATLAGAVVTLAVALLHLRRPAGSPGGMPSPPAAPALATAMATTCIAALVVAPLLPLGTVASAHPFHLDELTLASLRPGAKGDLKVALRSLDVARTLLGWSALASCLLAIARPWSPPRAPWTRWMALPLLPLTGGATGAALLFERTWRSLPAIHPSWNVALSAGGLVALALAVTALVRNVLLAFSPTQRPQRGPE